MLIKKLISLIAILVMIVSFQNCHVGTFEAQYVSELPSTLGDQVSCSVNGRNYYPGDQVSGYPMSSTVYPVTCGSGVVRTCLDSGQFDGSVPLFPSCNQLCVHPDTNNPIESGSVYYSYTRANGTTQAECDAARVASTCQASTGQFFPVVPTARFSSCLVQGQTCAYTNGTGISVPTGNATGSTVMGFVAQTATYPTLCGAQVSRTCQANGSWTGATPLYTSCAQRCLNPNTNMPEAANAQFTYYVISSGTQSQCDAALRVSSCQASTGLFNPAVAATRYASCTVVAPPVIVGRQLYDQSCASCHGQFDTSNLKNRTLSVEIINAAFNNIGAMNNLRGVFTMEQVASLPPLFATVVQPPNTSSFACTTADAEKQSSIDLTRLTGPELKNSYQAVVSATVWSNLSNYHYLIPTDSFDGLITNFVRTYTPDNVDQISRFNEQLALQLTGNAANITAFFGTCASATSFTKSCFDTFLTSKGPNILRTAIVATDNTELWAAVTRATTVPEQLKVLVQILFNDPRFLYHLELGEGNADANGLVALSSFEVANRIAYGMTSAPPDAALLADAKLNKLKLQANVNTHVDRIALTQAFKNRVLEFVKFYVGTSQTGVAPNLPNFMGSISGTNLDVAMTDEFNEFVNYVIFTQRGTLNDLFTSKASFPKTAALASVMGTAVWSSGNPVMANNHPGILTKPYMNLVSNPNSKLVQRGKKVRINMLCTDVPQPSSSDLELRPDMSEADLVNLTRRQYIDKATLAGASCVACHSKMNQMGFATNNYDSIGRYITNEKIYNTNNQHVATHAVVATVSPSITPNDTRSFASVTDFQTALGQSDAIHQCLSRKSFQFFSRKAEVVAQDSCRLNKLDTLVKNNMPLVNFAVENFKQPSVLYKRSN